MNETAAPAPKRRWNWRTILLIASLALNVGAAGALAARYFMHERIERMEGPRFAQLLPRKFFADLPRQRRRELLDILKSYRAPFREGRQALREAAVALAAALEAQPYDAAAADKAVQSFVTVGEAMMGHGATGARDLLSRLTQEERKLLAARLRERAAERK